MWHLTNIPKIVHFYWGNEKLSYLRYISIYSFRKLNPDWKIKIHVPATVSSTDPTWHSNEQKNESIETDYFEKLNDLQVIINRLPPFSNFDNDAHEVHKSDFFRWTILQTEGGVWSDFDIVYVHPMDNLLENTPEFCYYDTAFSRYKVNGGKYAISFMMASKNNVFFSKIHALSLIHYDKSRYQSIGSELLNNNFHRPGKLRKLNPENKFILMDEKCVYPIGPTVIDKFYEPMNDELKNILSDSNVIGLHWFAGYPASQNFESKINENNVFEFDNILAAAIQKLGEKNENSK